MYLFKWNFNSKVVCDNVGISLGDFFYMKILGVVWRFVEDCFVFEGVDLFKEIVFIKRVVFSFIVRLFDFLGFIIFFVMLVKVLF